MWPRILPFTLITATLPPALGITIVAISGWPGDAIGITLASERDTLRDGIS
jgi:hypothetical protein